MFYPPVNRQIFSATPPPQGKKQEQPANVKASWKYFSHGDLT